MSDGSGPELRRRYRLAMRCTALGDEERRKREDTAIVSYLLSKFTFVTMPQSIALFDIFLLFDPRCCAL